MTQLRPSYLITSMKKIKYAHLNFR